VCLTNEIYISYSWVRGEGKQLPSNDSSVLLTHPMVLQIFKSYSSKFYARFTKLECSEPLDDLILVARPVYYSSHGSQVLDQISPSMVSHFCPRLDVLVNVSMPLLLSS
jgi:hypothetical protein